MINYYQLITFKTKHISQHRYHLNNHKMNKVNDNFKVGCMSVPRFMNYD